MRDGEVSAREVVEATLERIERLDPRLNAFRVVFAERALAEADQADARRAAGQERPLLGVPVAIKDDADVAGEVTAWGGTANGGPQPRRLRRRRAGCAPPGAIVDRQDERARADDLAVHRDASPSARRATRGTPT